MKKNGKLRFAVIGCGGISHFHCNGLAKAGAEIAYAVDVRPEAAQIWVDKYGATYAPDYHEAIADESVDAVTVTTPTRLHHEVAIASLKAGKAVIVEKTLTENPKDSLKIVEAVRESGGLCFTAYMKRFFPAVRKAKELVPSLGQIISAHVLCWQPWGDVWTRPLPPPDGKPSFVVSSYGGGILVCGGSHTLDLTLWLLGRPEKLWANQYTRKGLDYDFRHTALMTLPAKGQTAGASISFEACAHPLKSIGYQKNGWDERLEINGVNGRLEIYTVTWNNPESAPVLLVHTDNDTGHVTEYRYPAVNAFDLEMAYFADCIRKGKQGNPDVHDGYAVDEVIAHIARSAKTGRVLSIDFKA